MLLVTTRWQHSVIYRARLVQVRWEGSHPVPGCRGSQGLRDSGKPGWNSAWKLRVGPALRVPDSPIPGTPLAGRGSCCSAEDQSQAGTKCFSLHSSPTRAATSAVRSIKGISALTLLRPPPDG